MHVFIRIKSIVWLYLTTGAFNYSILILFPFMLVCRWNRGKYFSFYFNFLFWKKNVFEAVSNIKFIFDTISVWFWNWLFEGMIDGSTIKKIIRVNQNQKKNSKMLYNIAKSLKFNGLGKFLTFTDLFILKNFWELWQKFFKRDDHIAEKWLEGGIRKVGEDQYLSNNSPFNKMWGQTHWHFSESENLALAESFSSALMRIDAMEETDFKDMKEFINHEGNWLVVFIIFVISNKLIALVIFR